MLEYGFGYSRADMHVCTHACAPATVERAICYRAVLAVEFWLRFETIDQDCIVLLECSILLIKGHNCIGHNYIGPS